MCLAFELYCLAFHCLGPFQGAKADFHGVGVKKRACAPARAHVTQYQVVLATGHGKV